MTIIDLYVDAFDCGEGDDGPRYVDCPECGAVESVKLTYGHDDYSVGVYEHWQIADTDCGCTIGADNAVRIEKDANEE